MTDVNITKVSNTVTVAEADNAVTVTAPGPQGAQGATGPTGPTGPAGPAGPAGVLGHTTYIGGFLFSYQSLTQWSSDFAVTFTAPASGKVLLSCQLTTFGSAGRFQWQELNTSTDHGELQYIRDNASDDNSRWLSVIVTGLTEDQSYTMVPATGRWSGGTAYFLGGRPNNYDAYYYAVAIGLPS